jgi:hypothetical protein
MFDGLQIVPRAEGHSRAEAVGKDVPKSLHAQVWRHSQLGHQRSSINPSGTKYRAFFAARLDMQHKALSCWISHSCRYTWFMGCYAVNTGISFLEASPEGTDGDRNVYEADGYLSLNDRQLW